MKDWLERASEPTDGAFVALRFGSILLLSILGIGLIASGVLL